MIYPNTRNTIVIDENTPKEQIRSDILPKTGWVAGLNHGAHDASAALCYEGSLVVWIEQERISRCKNAINKSPADSLAKCLEFADISMHDLDCIALGSDHERLLRWLDPPEEERKKIIALNHPDRLLPDTFTKDAKLPFVKVSHHLSHIASAFYPSGFDRTAALIVDAMGEDSSITLAKCENNSINYLETYGVEDSLGFFYEAALEYVGFTKFEAGKLMGLAAYGSPTDTIPMNVDLLKSPLLAIDTISSKSGRSGIIKRKDYLLKLFAQNCFPYMSGLSDEIMAYKDFAASIQNALEKVLQLLVEHVIRRSHCDRLVMAGGVALNCAANGKLANTGLMREIFIQPVSNDSGVALGAALETSAHLYGNTFNSKAMNHAYWGIAAKRNEIIYELKNAQLSYQEIAQDYLCQLVAEILGKQGIVAWHQGRAEVGPRALGARSLIADPRYRTNLIRLNNIKGREVWRPLAPSVLEESFHEYFDGYPNQFMLVAAQVKKSRRHLIPAVVHLDGSARPQVVNRSLNPCYAALLESFQNITNIPLVINTSLNKKNEPICNTVKDTVIFFKNSDIDALVIENFLVQKNGS
ncbi:MAG: hypothetical protein LWX08_13485 [Deltaproteobacteria bacterium]|jgi:carbamoyltransferase|nr:hypothetical protein [Deltaproteobacteria bacterium]